GPVAQGAQDFRGQPAPALFARDGARDARLEAVAVALGSRPGAEEAVNPGEAAEAFEGRGIRIEELVEPSLPVLVKGSLEPAGQQILELRRAHEPAPSETIRRSTQARRRSRSRWRTFRIAGPLFPS